MAKAVERLSSGLRVNRASDDAAGLSISESLTTQIRGSRQAQRNVMDGINLLRTAEGAFVEIQDMLQRMRELCVQGANGILTLENRMAIQEELEALKKQIDTAAYTTEFNGKTLLVDENKAFRPSSVPYTAITAGVAPGPWADPNAAEARLAADPDGDINGVTVAELEIVKAMLPGMIDGALRKAEGEVYASGIDWANTGLIPPVEVHLVIDPGSPFGTISTPDQLVINLYAYYGSGPPNPVTLQQSATQGLAHTFMFREDRFGEDVANTNDYGAFIAPVGNYAGLRQFAAVGSGESYLAFGKPPAGTFAFNSLGGDGGIRNSAWFNRYLLENYGLGAVEGMMDLIINHGSGNKAAIEADLETYLLDLTGEASRAALEATARTWIDSYVVPPTATDSLALTASREAQPLDEPLMLQVGAMQGETLGVTLLGGALGNLDYAGLVNVLDQDTAMRSIASLDKAIAQVSSARTQLGAAENRLEHTLTRLGNYIEAGLAARSRIRDTDLADEAGHMTRAQVMLQAATGVLQAYHRFQSDQVGALLDGAA